VVVVEFLAADQDAQRSQVGAGVRRIEVAVAARMAETIDDAGRGDRDPEHLDAEDDQSGDPEQEQVEREGDPDSQAGMTRIEIALAPVVRGAAAEALDGIAVGGLRPVEFGALEQHLAEPEYFRAVRIAVVLAPGVVLAMNRRPFLRD